MPSEVGDLKIKFNRKRFWRELSQTQTRLKKNPILVLIIHQMNILILVRIVKHFRIKCLKEEYKKVLTKKYSKC